MAMAEAIIQSRSPRLSSVDQFVCFSVQKGIFLQPLRDMADIAVLLLVNKINCLFTSLKFRTLMIIFRGIMPRTNIDRVACSLLTSSGTNAKPLL